jgi:hypothetical protein
VPAFEGHSLLFERSEWRSEAAVRAAELSVRELRPAKRHRPATGKPAASPRGSRTVLVCNATAWTLPVFQAARNVSWEAVRSGKARLPADGLRRFCVFRLMSKMSARLALCKRAFNVLTGSPSLLAASFNE